MTIDFTLTYIYPVAPVYLFFYLTFGVRYGLRSRDTNLEG
ncbi:hypothetical protein VPHK460_0302 [Vibrio phage K460]